jgi:transposase
MRTKIKNRIHSIVAKQGLRSSRSDLFGKKGLEWLQNQTLSPVFQEQVVSLLSIADMLSREIKKKDIAIVARTKLDQEAKLLMSMPGIGAFTATMIQAEVGTFARFASADKLASYAGLVSSSRSSGEKQRFGSITRAGSVYLRSIMVEAACHLRPSWGYLFSFYSRLKEKKGGKIARVALARKMLTILWHLATKKEPFRTLPLGDSLGVKR